MRQSVAFVAVLSGAAGLGALLVMPGRRTLDLAPQPADSSEHEPSAVPSSVIPAPPRTKDVAAAPQPTAPSHVHVDPGTSVACEEGMVLVDGVYCPYVGHRCEQMEDETRDLCASYATEALCEGALQRRRFCVDLHEYPNVAGVRPAVWVSFDDAKRACAIEGKRLCAAEEWELACEGTAMWPYPYGLTRDAAACNDHRPASQPDAARLDEPWTRGPELARVDGRLAAGAQPACISPFGVYDLTGNVEEWVEHANGHENEKPFRTARKGGSWARGKARCRPLDASEPSWHRAHDLGFRCCSDARGATAAVRSASATDRAPPSGRPAGSSGTKTRTVVLPRP